MAKAKKEKEVEEVAPEEVTEPTEAVGEVSPEEVVDEAEVLSIYDSRKRLVRTYSLEEHGPEYRKLADEYCAKTGAVIK